MSGAPPVLRENVFDDLAAHFGQALFPAEARKNSMPYKKQTREAHPSPGPRPLSPLLPQAQSFSASQRPPAKLETK
ncbi:hypothetical protein SBA3_1760024 [Candidatus Sulfopaludibacter sp. SbA3]|nr:hypothetical protein SBA3_1760024 [Candidatus Sulfopaludibacter sp. SbA3]